MLKKLVLTLVLASASLASAGQLTNQDIGNRFQLKADVYIMDETGKKIVSGPESTNFWKMNAELGTISGDWGSKFDLGSINIRLDWKLQNDGSIKVLMEEYGDQVESSKGPEFKNLLEKKDFVLENLEPVVWKVKNIKNRNLIIRFVPSLREVSTPTEVSSLPIAGAGILISDNQGYLWAEDVEMHGKYCGFTTHRGTLAISYVPFKGAKEMGIAEGDKITVNVDKKFQIKLKAASAFLPAGVTSKVYAIYVPEKKTKGFNSFHGFDSGNENRILDRLKK